MKDGFSKLYAAVPLLAASGAFTQFVPAPTDLTTKEEYAGINVRYKQVPGVICELDPNVKSYSKYADVENDQHIFCWLFEARNQDAIEAPLTINGGPGSLSMIGPFQKLGPCGVGPDLKSFNNPYFWSNASNMLFIDEPTTVDFSYSIPIQAIKYQAYHNFSVFPGNTYDYDPYNASVKAEWNNLYGEGNCFDQTKHCCATGQNSICARTEDFYANKVENLYDICSGRDEYDMRYLTPDPFPYSYYVEYLNTPAVQKAVGAFQNFSESSSTVSSAFDNNGDDDNREFGTIEACKKLLAAGVQVMLYYGITDYNCNWLGGQVVCR
ncbi:alpha/beta-hydrolase [Macroventuria anomochaeta]|uniref:Alpha/beta-hydrolase n=1 Tax=Macroventuria anomochaeta TaxID=301207 RepID=A0ACB6S518_9PLEO|nr:alpha/beta-hydrolase [Macroventuria anomochaeta]KAF2628720.1 alpha/beta-hydrolase [Macroventuria anomochaeta]